MVTSNLPSPAFTFTCRVTPSKPDSPCSPARASHRKPLPEARVEVSAWSSIKPMWARSRALFAASNLGLFSFSVPYLLIKFTIHKKLVTMYRTSIRLPQRCTQRDNRNLLVFAPNARLRSFTLASSNITWVAPPI